MIFDFFHHLKEYTVNQVEATQKLIEVTAHVTKLGAELSASLQKAKDLQAVIDSQANAVSPELEAAVGTLSAAVTAADVPVTP